MKAAGSTPAVSLLSHAWGLEAKLWQALYYDYEFAQPFLPQLERNLRWLEGESAKLRGYQEQLNTKCIEKNDR